jgi:hypothetical protein
MLIPDSKLDLKENGESKTKLEHRNNSSFVDNNLKTPAVWCVDEVQSKWSF